MIEIKESAVQQAAKEEGGEFIQLFTDEYQKVVGDEVTEDNMGLLTGEQHVLLSYEIFRYEVAMGGFCCLIQNGYGSYIFDNPFAKAMRLWGAKEFSKLVYKVKDIYDANREELERECTDEELMALCDKFEVFDDLEEAFFEMEEQVTEQIADYVKGHLELFAKIIK
jgi:hypothetical protein